MHLQTSDVIFTPWRSNTLRELAQADGRPEGRRYSAAPGTRKASVRHMSPSARGWEARQRLDGNTKFRAVIRTQGDTGAKGAMSPAPSGAPSFFGRPRSISLLKLLNTIPTHCGIGSPVQRKAVGDKPAVPAPATAGAAPAGDAASAEPVAAAVAERAILPVAPDAAGAGAAAGARPTPLLGRAASALADALGSFCDAVYHGVNAAGRGCVQALGAARGAYGSLSRQASITLRGRGVASSAATPLGAGHGAQPACAVPRVTVADLVDPLNRILHATAVLDVFKDRDIAYRDLLYIIEPKSVRVAADAAGTGLNAPMVKESSSLMRRLATGASQIENPWRYLAGLPGWDPSAADTAYARYLAYRQARYPDFDDMCARLRHFGDPKVMDSLKNHVESRRANVDAQAAFDEDAYILDAPLLPDGMPPVTARQLRIDIPRMRACLADMVAYLEDRANDR